MQIERLPNGAGIRAVFPDGATIALTTGGMIPCSICKAMQCEHFHQALPAWNRFKWEMAESPGCGGWGPTLLQNIGIIPPYIVDPALVYKQNRRAPSNKGEEIVPGVRVWHTCNGTLFHFWDNGHKLTNDRRLPDGHVYIGHDHPDGHTGCLICRNGCSHVAQALALEERL